MCDHGADRPCAGPRQRPAGDGRTMTDREADMSKRARKRRDRKKKAANHGRKPNA
ncbi:hypothetical protein GCM10011509_11970 [Ornithinimicrobium pekingense]|uniref:Uncharacterized protein n=1 Tax=Ornithinimicrobium pekingense TaxID=384677 RepID=A0ABQ2F924_9MICO|nr:hypothetical protein GCM10011509_11970 [Ornithinimicrobium pekingense]